MIEHNDILRWAKDYHGPKFHACLCDAPYHLTEIVKRFGKENSAPAKPGKDGSFARLSKGFMGATWDGGDEIAFQPSTWKAIGKHLHGGAFLMVFAGTRGYHRMASAIEGAGFIIHPAIGWSFSTGFPKATRVDDQIDSAAGQLPRVVGKKKHAPKFAAAEFEYREKDNGFNSKSRETFDVTEPATALSGAWAGHRYGMQAIKPAFEFLCVAQKPYERVSCADIAAVTGWNHWCVTTEIKGVEARYRVWKKWGVRLPSGHVPGRTAQVVRKALHAGAESSIEYWHYPEYGKAELVARTNVRLFRPWATDNSVACMLVTQGAGALNVDKGRIGTENTIRPSGVNTGIYGADNRQGMLRGSETGRWPANLILQHEYLPVLTLKGIISPEVKQLIWRYFDGYKNVSELRKSLHRTSGSNKGRTDEVLQPEVQERISEDTNEGTKPALWDSAHRRNATEDVGGSNAALVNSIRAKASHVEGRIVSERRISLCVNNANERCRSGACVADGTKEQCVCTGTSNRDGAQDWASIDEKRISTSPERAETRQQTREPNNNGLGRTFAAPSGDRTRDDGAARREPALEVFARDIPAGWLEYFEPTGENLGCNGHCTPGCAVARLGAQSGESSTPETVTRGVGKLWSGNGGGLNKIERGVPSFGDSGTAARFYFNVDWMYERLEDSDPVIYQAKASTAERDAGLDSLPTIRVDDGRQKPIDNAYQRGETGRKNPHPTVKPVSLCKHLASLLLPPDCYSDRRLLIPFAGVGSEYLGALLAGWEHITGVELEQKHVHVGNLRISKWRDMAAQLRTMNPDRIVQELTKPKSVPLTSAEARILWTRPIAVKESDYTGTMFDLA